MTARHRARDALGSHSRADAERPERHSHAERRNDHHTILIVLMLCVGMQPGTLCVPFWSGRRMMWPNHSWLLTAE
ncbi:hypothetical protein PsyrCH409_07595 [Pseudomonas viridiflava]|uniref:Uncharacterized protein n=1 Tax=Pseudomonas viridiflava TaxID=33069 RepID=A0AA46W3R3_PSEVI|nr:hypothetical protein PsyrCH409_07595 [Pseudomonas viridiflava]UZA71389.1 hypothetical protein EZZ81_25390 [Pseudomonas viridiflava]